jgi:hypothetical protein
MSRRPSGYLACSARKRSSSAYAGANSPAQRGMLRLNLRQFTRNAVRCCSQAARVVHPSLRLSCCRYRYKVSFRRSTAGTL